MGPTYDVFETPWGWMAVAGSERGIRCCSLPEATPERALEHVTATLRTEPLEHAPGAYEHFHHQLESYFHGERTDWDVDLDLDGATAFFQRAWDACRSIPLGETRTYAWLAREAGRPQAPRAAGQAMARNRIPIVIPCHRVIGSDGGLHGFAGPGLPMKARLLELERAWRPVPARASESAPRLL